MDVQVAPKISYDDLRRDAVMIEMSSYRIPVASIPHLIAMKSDTGRGKNMIDVEELRKPLGEGAP